MSAAKPSTPFTDKYIRSLKPRAKRYELIEPTRSGLRIRVAQGGTKTWNFVYRQNGRLFRKTLGTYPAMSLAQAHAVAAQDRLLLENKLNPVILAKEQKQKADLLQTNDPTVEAFCAIYIERYAKVNKRTWREDERILNKDVISRWGDLPLSHIKRTHIVALLDDLVARGAGVGANRAFAIVRKMFNYAIERAILHTNPCQGISKPAKEKARQFVLDDSMIRDFCSNLATAPISTSVRAALRVLLLTAQRPGEVAGMQWSEIDEDMKWWTLPPERAKNGLQHRVPLSPETRAVLNELRGDSAGIHVFSSRLRDRAITTSALDNAMRNNRVALGFDAALRVTPHDLRRTAASKMTEMGIPRLTVSKILNHADSSITAVYDRHSYDAEKADALRKWAVRLQSLIVIHDLAA
jgi:integrase